MGQMWQMSRIIEEEEGQFEEEFGLGLVEMK